MGTADEFLNSFFSTYPQARDGKLSMDELNQLVGEYQQKINSRPIDDFDGLSPEQMNFLLYAPFSPDAILQFSEDLDLYVNEVPLFKLSEMLINEIQQAGKLKLTANGNLPVRICEMLCNQNLIYWPFMKYVKRIREEEVPYLWPLKQYLIDSGIVKKRNNVLSVTKNGEKLLKESKAFQFKQILNYIAMRFHWGNWYHIQDDGQYGQLGWAYSLALLSKYGDTPRISEFYSLKLIQAFGKDLWDGPNRVKVSKDTEEFHRAYRVRFFEHFASWFGMVEIDMNDQSSLFERDEQTIRKSILFDQVFKVNL